MDTQLTLDMLLQTFETYNTLFWPVTWIIFGLGIVTLLLAFWPSVASSRIISALLGVLWLWTGTCFFLFAFAAVYSPALVFGMLFLVQGAAFLLAAWRGTLAFGFRPDVYGLTGLALGLYAIVGYVVVGYALGHVYPQAAILGAPCPLTVLTFGLLLMTRARVPWLLLVIPGLWAVGSVLPISVGVWEDLGLLIGGVAATAMLVYRDRRARRDPRVAAA